MIRQATIEDLPLIEPGAREFYAKSRFLRNFDMAHFRKNWEYLLVSGIGTIFLLIEHDKVIGFLGGTKFPDINSGELIASECFWFVRESSRGGGGLLYRAFERWAKDSKCKQIQMVHLTDSMPEDLESFYRNIGFEKAEVRYLKDLPCQ